MCARVRQFEELIPGQGSSIVAAALIWNTISVCALTGAFFAYNVDLKAKTAKFNKLAFAWTGLTFFGSIAAGGYSLFWPVINWPMIATWFVALIFSAFLYYAPHLEHVDARYKGLNWRLFWLATLGVVPAVGQSINGVMQTRNVLANLSGAFLFASLCFIAMGAIGPSRAYLRRICALGASIVMVGSFGIAGGVPAISPYASAVQTVAPLTSALLCLCIVVAVVAVMDNQEAFPLSIYTYELLSRSLFTGAVLCDLSGVFANDNALL